MSAQPNEVLIVFDDNLNMKNGSTTGYECAYHVQGGTIKEDNGIIVSSYYDLSYPCSDDPRDYISVIAPTVLTNLAEYFNILPNGTVCTIPSLPLWVIGVSSAPEDTLVPNLECQKLTTSGKSGVCCGVVHAPITFWWTNHDYRMSDILGVLSIEFNSPMATSSISSADVAVQYVGAFMDTSAENGSGSLSPAISAPDKQATQQASASQHHFTLIGGFVLAALVLAVLGAIFLLVRRNRRRKSQRDIQDALAKSEDTHSDGPTLEVDVMSDGCDYPPHVQQSFPHSFDDDMANTPNSYTFDLANSMKLDVLGTYSGLPTSMAVVPPYPMEETSDSEVDSWAQTDGTVGSLEDRLEEITAEI